MVESTVCQRAFAVNVVPAIRAFTSSSSRISFGIAPVMRTRSSPWSISFANLEEGASPSVQTRRSGFAIWRLKSPATPPPASQVRNRSARIAWRIEDTSKDGVNPGSAMFSSTSPISSAVTAPSALTLSWDTP